jgi:hypothetical protein
LVKIIYTGKGEYMIMKWSNLPSGESFTIAAYNYFTNPETEISLSSNTLVEDGSTGVYYIDFGSQLDSYDIVRISNDQLFVSGWVKVGIPYQEISPDTNISSSADITEEIIQTIKDTIKCLSVTVKPETKVLGPCVKPTIKMPKVVSNTFKPIKCKQ